MRASNASVSVFSCISFTNDLFHCRFQKTKSGRRVRSSSNVNCLFKLTCLFLRVDNARFISKSASNKYSQSVPIQHWQLRNSIACLSTAFNSTATNLVVMQRSSVIKLQLPDMQQESILEDLNFRPASMAVGNGYVAAGGQNSQLAIRHLPTNTYPPRLAKFLDFYRTL